MTKEQTAADYFSTGKNCAQSVLMAFAKELNIPEDQAFNLASGFGGGIGKQGQVCGAVSGAIMVIGLKYAKEAAPDKANTVTHSLVNEFLEEFKKQNPSIICKELIGGLDLNNPEDAAEWKKHNLHDVTCLPAVKSAVRILENL